MKTDRYKHQVEALVLQRISNPDEDFNYTAQEIKQSRLVGRNNGKSHNDSAKDKKYNRYN